VSALHIGLPADDCVDFCLVVWSPDMERYLHPGCTLDERDCSGCERWVCNRCGEVVSYEQGCADDTPGLCDDCVWEIERKIADA